jgi:FkbM family methyltransferase
MPSRVHLAKRSIALSLPHKHGAEADFIQCFLLNSYGLGHSLGQVKTIIDIGAHLGFFSLAARCRYPGAAIHAYEPNPRILPYLFDNTSGLDIQIYTEAVGNKDCYVTMIDTGPSHEARTKVCDGPRSGIRQVSFTQTVERIGGTIDLLKLDCEGAEWEILTPNRSWESVRNVRMEYHLFNGETVEFALARFRELGFKVVCLKRTEEGGIIWAARS